MSKIIRKGNPFKHTDVESAILKGLPESYPLHRDEKKFMASDPSCPRKMVKYFYTTRRGVFTPASKAYMAIGVSIHEMVTDALYKSSRLIFKEFKLPPREKPDIRGIIDAIFLGADDKIMGLEIKSCGNLPGRPRDEHELQALIYSALSGLDFSILYVSRKVAGYDGKLMLKSFDVECTDDMMKHALTKMCVAYFADAKEVLPHVPPTFSRDNECRFCPFQDECWDDEKEDLPTADIMLMEAIYEKAEERAEKILLERESARSGILKHIQRHASPDVQKKMSTISWS